MVQRAEEHRPLREFLTKVVRNVFKKLKSQPILFVELLFWKTRGECHNITVDHMLNRIGQDKRSLKRGGDTYDALGDDEADAVPDAPSSRKRREALEDALGEDEHGEGCAESLNPSKRSLGDALGDDEGDIVAGVGTDAEVNTYVYSLYYWIAPEASVAARDQAGTIMQVCKRYCGREQEIQARQKEGKEWTFH